MEKCYNFEIKVKTTMSGYVFANNEREARKLIKNQEWDEAYKKDNTTIKIKNITEEK